MACLQEFANQIEFDVPIGRMTWFRMGGRARAMARPASVEELASMLNLARAEGWPVKVLGRGANVLVRDAGFDGLVIRLDSPAFRNIERLGAARVRAGAGVDLMPFSRELSEQGLSGLECLAGVPATVGGAVRMNAGGRHGDIGAVVSSIIVFDAATGVRTLQHGEIGFAYRRTNLAGSIVISADFDLTPADPVETGERYAEYFAAKTATQPLKDKSAGCIFKNPPGASAGMLIDRAGLKSLRVGGAYVSDVHANFIVADKTGTASDVLALVDAVREGVMRVHGIELELEIDVW